MSAPIDVLFDGEHFVAVDKPAGWLSVPSRWGDRDERPCLGRLLEQQIGARLWPVHRLDEEASGVILFARNAAAHAEANGWFEGHRVSKRYEALTEVPPAGVPAPHRETWRSLLLRGKKRAYETPHGKPSETRAQFIGVVKAEGGDALAWELEPVTGRPHQLRVELARHGFPILGDALYGAQRPFVPGAIALRCVSLEFIDAETAIRRGLPLRLSAPPLAEWLKGQATSRG